MSQPQDATPRSQEAVERNQQQAEFEIDFYRRILQRHPQHVDALKRQAQLLTGKGMRAEELQCNEQLASVLPGDANVRYHLACSLAAVGKLDDAICALSAAIELGYRDFEHLETDPDLELLRQHPRFHALLRGEGTGN